MTPSVEPKILIEITLKTFLRTMVVYFTKPSFDIHDMNMHLRKSFTVIR
ncbi:hypothetical protein BACUNI_02250 [Bacteroides uniformis ATCC 8492]|uniref:Uncharacterized protein n=1 Tax=Bacteroides uniformis (strain ATCC 8492 / DSM 6597 / CCUG 4942 / CIP 103695 / JCM 5828 / KCTC 5204 / NCTC 13054 / VPI 0061) TaxID=411479 RepID=A0ABC9NCM0_BACUC|nr:hypothetical protein BACUNI_02250 [Bacteroides uniformis ATCC 8492]